MVIDPLIRVWARSRHSHRETLRGPVRGSSEWRAACRRLGVAPKTRQARRFAPGLSILVKRDRFKRKLYRRSCYQAENAAARVANAEKVVETARQIDNAARTPLTSLSRGQSTSTPLPARAEEAFRITSGGWATAEPRNIMCL